MRTHAAGHPDQASRSGPTLHVIEAGSGPALGLLHPNPLDSWSWLYQLAHFSAWFRAIAVDLPGYGHSPPAPPGVTIEGVGEMVWQRWRSMADGPFIILGVSYGARVAKEIAATHPEDVAALVLSGTRGPSGPRDFARERRAAFLSEGLAYRARYVRELFSPAFREDPLCAYLVALYGDRAHLGDLSSIVRTYEASQEAPNPPPEERIACPTLVLAGSEDKAWPGSFELARVIRLGEHETIEGAGHVPNLERPLEYDQRVLAFLDRNGLLPTRPALERPEAPRT